MKSADGKGRTLFEMLAGRNKRDMTAQELQVHNPLQAKVGWSVSVSYEADLSGYKFFVESIWVWETKIGDKTVLPHRLQPQGDGGGRAGQADQDQAAADTRR